MTRRIARLEREQEKLLRAHYVGAIDVDLLGREERRIASELVTARQRLESLGGNLERACTKLEEAIRLASVAARRYRRYSPKTRREFNRALFKAIYLSDKRLDRFEWSDAIEPLIASVENLVGDASPAVGEWRQAVEPLTRTAALSGGGSKYATMVEAAGIEPAHDSERRRRAPVWLVWSLREPGAWAAFTAIGRYASVTCAWARGRL